MLLGNLNFKNDEKNVENIIYVRFIILLILRSKDCRMKKFKKFWDLGSLF